ncbi:ATP-binding protein [Actinomadura barringtoniae]|uniref:ATP-binding protein n=1 Tax=Actinomadura barringtoniae TaxID=1427535 RepID=A0A939PSW1_9ACTN|nr:ATP-binding protein [Actinomadura barringtoniae]MBO2455673.1 ATP-binding protein [Actinomadura barringtoniae]
MDKSPSAAARPYFAVPLSVRPQAVKAARTLTKAALEEWALDCLVDDVVLVTSELVTNSLESHADAIILFLVREADGQVNVTVWDDGPGLPEEREMDLASDGGRGLLITRAVSNECGWEPTDALGGKYVWARLGPKPNETER